MTGRCRWTISCGWRRAAGDTFVIDTGFNAEVSKKRNRTFLRCPVETLGALDIDVNAVEDVILTHLHYDHVGNFDRFPKARFHLQEREMAYATGRYMRYPRLSHSFEVEDVCGIVRLNYARRVTVLRWRRRACARPYDACGRRPFGRTAVRSRQDPARLRRGRLRRQPFLREHGERAAVYDGALHIGEMLEGFDKLIALAPDESHIVPGMIRW